MVWVIVAAVGGAVLIATVGAWVAYRLLDWRLRRPECQWAALEWRLRMLRQALEQQEPLWPVEARPGRYAAPDEAARGHLAALRAAMDGVVALRPTLAFYAATPLTAGDVATGKAWGPLLEARRVWRASREALALLAAGSEALKGLVDERQVVADIPRVVRVNLGMYRGRLAAARERLLAVAALKAAEADLGVGAGADADSQGESDDWPALWARLDDYDARAGRCLREVNGVTTQRLHDMLARVDDELSALRAGLAEVEGRIAAAAAERPEEAGTPEAPAQEEGTPEGVVAADEVAAEDALRVGAVAAPPSEPPAEEEATQGIAEAYEVGAQHAAPVQETPEPPAQDVTPQEAAGEAPAEATPEAPAQDMTPQEAAGETPVGETPVADGRRWFGARWWARRAGRRGMPEATAEEAAGEAPVGEASVAEEITAEQEPEATAEGITAEQEPEAAPEEAPVAGTPEDVAAVDEAATHEDALRVGAVAAAVPPSESPLQDLVPPSEPPLQEMPKAPAQDMTPEEAADEAPEAEATEPEAEPEQEPEVVGQARVRVLAAAVGAPVARWAAWRRRVDERRYGPEELPIHWSHSGEETDMTFADGGTTNGTRGDGWGNEHSRRSEPPAGDDSAREDPRYGKGLTHLQAGHWEEAIQAFEALAVAYPDSGMARRALDEARFKADLDANSRVRPKRWIFPWKRVVVYAAVFALVGLLGVGGAMAIGRPAMQEIREQSRLAGIARQVRDCNAQLEIDALDAAERCYAGVLVEDPANLAAINGLRTVADRRDLLDMYTAGVAAQEAGRYDEALEMFTDLTMRSPRYKDVTQRIGAIARQKDTDDLFASAEADYDVGNYPAALAKYGALREQNINYRPETIAARIFHINLTLGKELAYHNPPLPGRMQEARDYFDRALTLQPRNTEAVTEQRLVRLFIDGRARYDDGRWEDAIGRLRPLYDERPNYMGGMVMEMLYDAYIASGDAVREGDSGRAYEQYRKASTLAVEDKALAMQRMEAVVPFLTPTATPTNTPLPTNTPRPAVAGAGPAATATATPDSTPRVLATYRNQIIFFADHPQQAGLWAMEPNGTNRQYLGNSASLRREYDALLEASRLSPDGRYRLFVRDANPTAQIFVQLPPHPQYGEQAPRQLSRHTGLSYDPVWSPDGSRVVYVSQEDGGDDIWVMNADGTRPRNLTRNQAWEKRPAWSPDSNRIVFWSSRTGLRQIHVMDAEGRNVQNISNTSWDEYDPIWVR
jgi:TolB protein